MVENKNSDNEIIYKEEIVEKDTGSIDADMSVNSFGGYKNRWNYEEYEKNKKRKKPAEKNKGLKIFAASMTAVFLLTFAALIFSLSNNTFPSTNGTTPTSSTLPQTVPYTAEITPVIKIPTPDPNSKALTKQQIIKKCKSGVVGISVQTPEGSAIGTGFIITTDGYIVTNCHVVEDATNVTVLLNDGKQYNAKIIGKDKLSDVAVIKIAGKDLPALEMGDSSLVEEGDDVIAIGTPAGLQFAGTNTYGIVSAINRNVAITDDSGKVTKTMTLIQIDAAINPGNSGGPLLNCFGQVIGINTLGITSYEGMGFALPINGVIPIVNILIDKGVVTERPEGEFVTGAPTIGIMGRVITKVESVLYDLPEGVYVYSTTKGGAADLAGINRGDILIKFDGHTLTEDVSLTDLISLKKVGDKVEVVLIRGDEEMTLTVTLKSSE